MKYDVGKHRGAAVNRTGFRSRLGGSWDCRKQQRNKQERKSTKLGERCVSYENGYGVEHTDIEIDRDRDRDSGG